VEILNHPCFNSEKAKTHARIHLPIAEKCNIQCKYCNRKYDCINESRPGVTSKILSPKEAAELFFRANKQIPNLAVVGFAGPGDVLANFDKVLETVDLIKKDTPEILFCLSTNGLLLDKYSQDIIKAGFSHVTITINTVDEALIPLIYNNFSSKQDAKNFIKNQLEGLKVLSEAGIICKVNTLLLSDINENHVEEVVKTVKNYGAKITNITRLIPAEGSDFEKMLPIPQEKLNEIRQKCSLHLKQMLHCQQCRADAAGLLGHDVCLY